MVMPESYPQGLRCTRLFAPEIATASALFLSLTIVYTLSYSTQAANLTAVAPGEARPVTRVAFRVAGVLRHLRASLRWAAKIGLITQAPAVLMPKTGKRRRAKGRPLTPTEQKSLLAAVPQIAGKKHAPAWEFYLRCLLASGLRLAESLRLSWDSSPVRLQLTGRDYPCIVFHGEGQKSGEDEILPTWSNPLPASEVSRTVTAIGKAAGIVTGRNGSHASCHDLRRTFGTAWALKVAPVVLMRLMRHASIQTTMEYYVDIDVNDIAKVLWTVPRTVPRSGRKAKTAPQKPRQKRRERLAG